MPHLSSGMVSKCLEICPASSFSVPSNLPFLCCVLYCFQVIVNKPVFISLMFSNSFYKGCKKAIEFYLGQFINCLIILQNIIQVKAFAAHLQNESTKSNEIFLSPQTPLSYNVKSYFGFSKKRKISNVVFSFLCRDSSSQYMATRIMGKCQHPAFHSLIHSDLSLWLHFVLYSSL